MTEAQMEEAYQIFFNRIYNGRDLDLIVDQARSLPRHKAWMRSAREGLWLSSRSVAKKMGISPSAYLQMERREHLGSLSVATLEKAAEAMGCELVYAIRPRGESRFSRVVWFAFVDDAIADGVDGGRQPRNWARVFASRVKIRMENSTVRRRLGLKAPTLT